MGKVVLFLALVASFGSLPVKAAPANDQCAGAIALLPGVAVNEDTTTATSTGDPVPTCQTVFGSGVWFTYTPSETAPVLVSSCGSSFDTAVAIYTGTCGALTEIACNDDSGPDCVGVAASVVFNATSNTTYHILAGGYNGTSGTLQIVAQLANDQCHGAVALATGVPHIMSTLDATGIADPVANCSSLSNGVWFTYIPGVSGVVTLSTCGSDFDTVVQAYTGTCGALGPIGCNDDSGQYMCPSNHNASFAEFLATGGTQYYVLAGGWNGIRGNLSITANVVPATTLQVNSFPNSVHVGAFPNDTLGLTGGNTGFSLTYASNAVVSVSAPPNDGLNLFQKWQVDGADYSVNQTINVTMGANHTLLAVYVPPNDQCAGAIALTTSVPYTESTAGATSTGDPFTSCNGSNGVWFTYTPSVSGFVTINTCGSDFDTVLQAYSGACGALTAIQCNDDQGLGACPAQPVSSFLEFPGTAATTYHILAAGFIGERGNLTIVANVVNTPIRTLTINSAPTNSGVSIFSEPTDTSGVFDGPTPSTRTYVDGLVVEVSAPTGDGFNVFQKWQLDGVDYSTVIETNITMGADHTVTAVFGPPNDPCAGAIALSSGVPYTENTTTATSTADPIPTCQATFGKGVWFTYTPSVGGIVIIDTCGSDFDTVVQAYAGTCGALMPVSGGGCNDDSLGACTGNSHASYADFPATAGTTYYILAGGWNGQSGILHIVANVAAAQTLTVNSTPNSGVAMTAIPPDTGANLGGPTPFTRTYGAGTVVHLTAPASDGFNVFLKWQLDGVDQAPGTALSFAMNSGHTATAVYASPNDNCLGAIGLTNGVLYTMNTAGATSIGDPLVPCGPLSNGVWFAYKPAAHEQVTISTCGSDFDTMLGVFTGTCGALERVAYGCDDDNGPNCNPSLQASVVINGFAGVTYYILAGGYNGLTGNLNMLVTSGLVNDDCVAALPLYFGVPFSMTTSNATSAGDPVPACATAGKGVWFTFNSPITGPVHISTCGSSFDTVLDVYTGTCGALVNVACNDDNGPSCSGAQASVLISATNGTTYYILAGGYSSASGELTIMAGTPPTLNANLSGTTADLSWPIYYSPYYLLQQQIGPMGIGSGPWQDILPNTYGTNHFGPVTGNPPTFYRLVTP
jgi:hypothetical protein